MTTTLNCIQWMVNQEGQNPCLIAQEVGQLCNSGYTVSLASFQERTYIPDATTANGCICSWSIYNLLSACSYCVGQYQYISWSTWTTSCGSIVPTTYLPSGLGVSQGIPFWAATNPSTWESDVFNITQAADIAAENQPDVTGIPLQTSTAATSSSVSVGMIVGLLVGGISIIIIGGSIVLCTVYRRRRKTRRAAATTDPSFYASSPVVSPPVQNQAPLSYPRTTPAPISTYPVTDAADMITPFLAASSSRQPTTQAHASPVTGKAAEAMSGHVIAPPRQRARLNPPPYSPSEEPRSSRSIRRSSTRKERMMAGSISRATTDSGRSRPSTRESMTTIHAGAQNAQNPLQAASEGGTAQCSGAGGGGVARVDGGDGVTMAYSDGRDPGGSEQHAHAV